MSGLVFAAIAPHGSYAIEEACTPAERALGQPTRDGMAELGRRFDDARVDATIVLTPHNVHVEGSMAVVFAGSIAGALDEAPSPVALDVPVDRRLALEVARAMVLEDVPVVGVTYGANDPDAAEFPMDWGTLIPLWRMGGRSEPPVPIVMVAPARDLSAQYHVDAGRAIASAAAASGKRVALIASADHSHTHLAAGPYGFHASSAVFDRLVVDAVEADDLGRLVDVSPEMLEDAKPDSWWQLLMLHGALGDAWHGELLSYEAPTYYGMLCAAYAPR